MAKETHRTQSSLGASSLRGFGFTTITAENMATGRQVSAEPIAKRLHLDSQGDREKPLRMAWAFEMTGTKMTVFVGGRTRQGLLQR